jgi:hypothetical protein
MRIDDPNVQGNLTLAAGSTANLTGSFSGSIEGNSIISGSISGSLQGNGNSITNIITSQSTNNNNSSGSVAFWQGSLTEYNAISASADNNIVYFVVE